MSQYVLVGRALARFFGDRAVWSLALGAPIESAFGPVAGRVLAIAGWQEWMRRREPPFTRDASEAFAWVKLADAARGPSPLSAQIARAVSLDPLRGARELPDLLAAADAIPWRELPWWREAPSAADATLLRQAVAAMFHVDVLLATFQTHPLTPAALHLDAEACVISRDRDPRGAGPGEPPRWIAPPPLCRRLRERGCSRLSVGSAARGQLLSQILEDVPWMCSPS